MTGTQVKRSIFVCNWKAIEISGRLAPQTRGFPWFRRLLASKCLSPRDSHTQLLEQTGRSCPTDIVSITFPPQQPPALPPSPHLATQSTPAHHGSYPVLFGPPLPEKSQPRTSHQSPGPPMLPHRAHCGSRPSSRRPSPINATLSLVLPPGCAGGVWE